MIIKTRKLDVASDAHWNSNSNRHPTFLMIPSNSIAAVISVMVTLDPTGKELRFKTQIRMPSQQKHVLPVMGRTPQRDCVSKFNTLYARILCTESVCVLYAWYERTEIVLYLLKKIWRWKKAPDPKVFLHGSNIMTHYNLESRTII